MKIANIDRESLHIFWTTWEISMKFSGKVCLVIILKVTKNQGFTLSLWDTFFEKPQGGGRQIDSPPSPSRFRANNNIAPAIIDDLFTKSCLEFGSIYKRSEALDIIKKKKKSENVSQSIACVVFAKIMFET